MDCSWRAARLPGLAFDFHLEPRAPMFARWAWPASRSIAQHALARSLAAARHTSVPLAPGMIETSDAAGAPSAP
ncbi:unnamed protein product [Plutella xylostella]|uniref:(diamondback moth) hypothetical protein n=1 Tax=Plutella xylostella TaxID=51655 RepID=A0A8S4E4E9_PLUXY|nr:unnamed protein product [Plutella xylostella]